MLGKLTGLIVVVGVVAAVLWGSGYFQATATQTPQDTSPESEETVLQPVEIGQPLYSLPIPKLALAPPPMTKTGVAADPIVIPDCQLAVVDKEEVPSQREGIILFIGTEIPPGQENTVPKDLLIEIRLGDTIKKFRKLRDDDEVQAGQLLALIDDRVARDEWVIKKNKVSVAEAEVSAAEATRDEAQQQYEIAIKLHGRDSKALSTEALRTAKLAALKYFHEAEAKKRQVDQAKSEFSQAQTILGQHEIRASISGNLKTIYKHPGEAVKSSPSYEPLFLLVSLKKLRAEGLVEEQHLPHLAKGMKVAIERSIAQKPLQTLWGHLQEVTGVAVSRDAQPRIVSCSLDSTVRVWDRATNREIRVLKHPSAVRAVACMPPGQQQNLCLSGGSDGVGRLWDLDSADTKPLRSLDGKHRGAINSVAFSPDGKYCATAGDDRDICLWETATGKLLYRLKGHAGAVTSIQFTPESQLVSAARDNTLRIWKLGTEAGRSEEIIPRRSGDVTQLGVTPDGKHGLFDPWQSKSLRLLSLPNGLTEGVLKNPSGAGQFTTLALFSPDGQLVLTAGAADARLQLWRSPLSTGRAYVLRQLESEERSQANCGAFSPDGSFVVAGTRDKNVLVWPVPSKQEIEHSRTAKIVNIERSLDSSSRQVRIWAELDDSEGLIPGASVTMVRYPEN